MNLLIVLVLFAVSSTYAITTLPQQLQQSNAPLMWGKAIATSENTIFVGAPSNNATAPGSVYVYTYNSTNWNLFQIINAPSGSQLYFGWKLAAGSQGLLVGSQGTIYYYTLSTNYVLAQSYLPTSALTGASTRFGATFDWNGQNFVATFVNSATPTAYLFTLNSTNLWNFPGADQNGDFFCTAGSCLLQPNPPTYPSVAAIKNNNILVADPSAQGLQSVQSGVVTAYTVSGGANGATINCPSQYNTAGSLFGLFIALGNNTALISQTNSIHYYKYNGAAWTYVTTYSAGANVTSLKMSDTNDVALATTSGNTVTVYTYAAQNDTWQQTDQFNANSTDASFTALADFVRPVLTNGQFGFVTSRAAISAGPISCTPGYFGTNCATCVCPSTGTCDYGISGSGQCLDCDENHIGVYCNVSCSCQSGVCNSGRYTNGQCLPGTCYNNSYGANCLPCSPCVGGQCDNTTGTCVCDNSTWIVDNGVCIDPSTPHSVPQGNQPQASPQPLFIPTPTAPVTPTPRGPTPPSPTPSPSPSDASTIHTYSVLFLLFLSLLFTH